MSQGWITIRTSCQQNFPARLRDEDCIIASGRVRLRGVGYQGHKFRFTRLLGDMQLVERSGKERALAAIRTVRERQQQRDGRGYDMKGMEREIG